jgi:hypothetical protein
VEWSVGTADEDGAILAGGLSRIVIPDATFERFFDALKDAGRGDEVAVKPMVNLGPHIVAIGVCAGLLTPVKGVAKRKEPVAGRDSAGQAFQRIGGEDRSGLVIFDAFSFAVRMKDLQRPSVAGLGLDEASDAVGRSEVDPENGTG